MKNFIKNKKVPNGTFFHLKNKFASNTDRVTQNIRVRNDAATAYRVFFTPAAPKYIKSVKKIVSEEPIIIDAHLDAKLSGPDDENRLSISAVHPLPDIGRMIIIDTISGGI